MSALSELRERVSASEIDLIPHEIEVLKMLAGERPGEWGAWVAACLETLQSYGYCTPGPHYKITPCEPRLWRPLPPPPQSVRQGASPSPDAGGA